MNTLGWSVKKLGNEHAVTFSAMCVQDFLNHAYVYSSLNGKDEVVMKAVISDVMKRL